MNPAEALICAKASEAIYGTSQDLQGQATSQQVLAPDGFSISAWIDLQTIFKDVCAFVASSANYNLLVFRGTKVPQDWMTDLSCTPARSGLGAQGSIQELGLQRRGYHDPL